MHSFVSGLVARIVSIGLPWDIDVKFGDLVWSSRSRYYCPKYGLHISVIQFLPHIFVCWHFILCSLLCLCISCSYLFHIFSSFSFPFHHPSSITQLSINLFFYLNVLFALSSTVSYFSCFLLILPSLEFSVIQLFQSSILMLSPSSVYLWFIYFQTPCTFLHSSPILCFPPLCCLLCTARKPALLMAVVV